MRDQCRTSASGRLTARKFIYSILSRDKNGEIPNRRIAQSQSAPVESLSHSVPDSAGKWLCADFPAVLRDVKVRKVSANRPKRRFPNAAGESHAGLSAHRRGLG